MATTAHHFVLDQRRRLWHPSRGLLTTRKGTVPNQATRGFGLLIAYILPGFTLLLGLATVSEPLRLWLVGAGATTLAVGGVLYITASSVVAGMILNAMRWAIIDTAHHATGLHRPVLNDALLSDRLPAFERLVEDHFRYYQFYGNTALAALIGFIAWRLSPHSIGGLWPEIALISLETLLVAASRDALRRYYRRTSVLLAAAKERSHDKRKPPKDR